MANPATSRGTAERRATRCASTCPAPPHQPPRKVPVAPHAAVVVVIEGVDVTAADEPVARKTRSGEGRASPHRATQPPGVKTKIGPPSQRACALPSSSPTSVPCCVRLGTAPELCELSDASLHRASDNIECRGRERVPSESGYTRTAPRHCTDPGWMWRASRTLRWPRNSCVLTYTAKNVYLCLSIPTV